MKSYHYIALDSGMGPSAYCRGIHLNHRMDIQSSLDCWRAAWRAVVTAYSLRQAMPTERSLRQALRTEAKPGSSASVPLL
jgi:hypothetical protein